MTPTDKSPAPPVAATQTTTPRTVQPRREFTVNYTQRDVDAIREQVEQGQAAKRRLIVLALMVTLAALVGAVILLSTSYGLYSKSNSDRQKLTDETAGLKSLAEKCEQQLAAKKAQEDKANQARAEAQAKMDKVLPEVLRAAANPRDGAALAQMIYNLPQHMIETDRKPPDSLFHNWRVTSGATTETYTLVGGFVDGKWVIYSNLVARH
jgi:hypothetical protein